MHTHIHTHTHMHVHTHMHTHNKGLTNPRDKTSPTDLHLLRLLIIDDGDGDVGSLLAILKLHRAEAGRVVQVDGVDGSCLPVDRDGAKEADVASQRQQHGVVTPVLFIRVQATLNVLGKQEGKIIR